MKLSNILLMWLVLAMFGCNGESDYSPKKCAKIIVTGQSNAEFDWSYFEDITGLSVDNIARGGHTIDDLIHVYDGVCTDNVVAIFFIHGEHDSMNQTDGDHYSSSVERYRLMIKDVPMFISLVGYNTNESDDYKFDYLRNYQHGIVAFRDAKKFRDWGMLRDSIHFNKDAQIMVMDAFAESLWNSGVN